MRRSLARNVVESIESKKSVKIDESNAKYIKRKFIRKGKKEIHLEENMLMKGWEKEKKMERR